MNPDERRPWYREPWPWILAAGPALVVVAGIYTAWLAIKTNDGLVTDDYYKKGLVADQTIARSSLASRLGLVASVRLTSERLYVSLSAASPAFSAPPGILVTVSHPTRAGLDQSRAMSVANGTYSSEFRLPAAGHWLVLIEDEPRTWRLLGKVVLPADGEIRIGGNESGPKPEPADIRN